MKISGFLEAKGAGEQTIFPTLIASSGIILDPLLQELLGLPNVPSGNAGNVFITTKNLMLDDYAQVTVRNDGLGKAGTLEIDANSVRLENKVGITASTESGQGGNIKINSDDWLLMRRNSQISTNAGNAQTGGDGGQINIEIKSLMRRTAQDTFDIGEKLIEVKQKLSHGYFARLYPLGSIAKQVRPSAEEGTRNLNRVYVGT